MQQKIIYLHYLLIGISAIFLAGSCGKETIEYNVKADFVYKNETNYTIELISGNSFSLPPNGKHIIKIEGEGEKNPTKDNYVPPFLSGILIFDIIKCDTLRSGSKAGQGEGPAGIQNYESKKIAERHFVFTYRFTEADYQKATDCQ